jgi:hypothetical protein
MKTVFGGSAIASSGVLIVVLSLIVALCPVAYGIGYNVFAEVDNTTWSIDRSTVPLTFEMEGTVKGTGMVIRDTTINPCTLAGVGESELTHALDGALIITEKTTVVSKAETPVIIVAEIKGKNERANITINDSEQVTINESANITINETWSTLLSTSKHITYVGSGISTKERYENNGDVICTAFDVIGLTKESRFDTILLRNDVSAEITPGHVNETILTNKSSYYVLSSISLGGRAHVGCRSDEGMESSEDYIGIFKIDTAITMKELPSALPEPPSEWMVCP